MKPHAKTLLFVWIALMVITCASVLAAEVIPFVGVVTTVVVLLGYAKARLIFVHFMELKKDLMPHRAILEAWGVIAVLVIVVPYWLTIL